MRRFSWFVILAGILLLTACSSRQVTLGERFELQQDERVKISGEPLSIQLEGVGREWDDAGEYINASFIVRSNGDETKVFLYIGEAWEVDGYLIEMISANPFGDITSCELVVTKR